MSRDGRQDDILGGLLSLEELQLSKCSVLQTELWHRTEANRIVLTSVTRKVSIAGLGF